MTNMPVLNIAACQKCKRTSPKCIMRRITNSNGICIGYEHTNCNDFADMPNAVLKNSTSDFSVNVGLPFIR